MTVLTTLYVICALLLAAYTSGQLILLVQYWRHRHDRPAAPAPADPDWPAVTVQLPVYNEALVITRLLMAVARLDYPRDRLCVQVLDDSDDVTSAIAAEVVQKLRQTGIRIQHIRRTDRTGYKAGALQYGLGLTTTDYIAIFDADFVPPSDFLRRTLPHLLADKRTGVIQTRWGHLNAHDNHLTAAQALSVDSHFVIEQAARSQSGWMVPFNGTGGVWRTSCIRDAGGWSFATLTEDLDLSYRAQLAGWRSVYLPDVVVPGELPPQLAAYRQQQARWASGSTQCLIRLAKPLWRSDFPLWKRLMATHHLCQYLPQALMLVLLLLTPPLIHAQTLAALPLAPLGLIGLVPPVLYAVSQRTLYPNWRRRLLALPVLALIATGLTLSNTLAILRAFRGQRGAFLRTPKFNLNQSWQRSSYALRGSNMLLAEVALALYALWGIVLAGQHAPAVIPYLMLYAASFVLVAGWGITDQIRLMRHTPARPLASSTVAQVASPKRNVEDVA